MFPGTDHSSSYCSSLLTATVLACYERRGLQKSGLTTARLLSCSAYFPLPYMHGMQRWYRGGLLLKHSCSLSQKNCS